MTFFIYWWCIMPQLDTTGSGITNREWNVSVNVGRVLDILIKNSIAMSDISKMLIRGRTLR